MDGAQGVWAPWWAQGMASPLAPQVSHPQVTPLCMHHGGHARRLSAQRRCGAEGGVVGAAQLHSHPKASPSVVMLTKCWACQGGPTNGGSHTKCWGVGAAKGHAHSQGRPPTQAPTQNFHKCWEGEPPSTKCPRDPLGGGTMGAKGHPGARTVPHGAHGHPQAPVPPREPPGYQGHGHLKCTTTSAWLRA